MNRAELLELLQDNKVQQAIRNIVDAPVNQLSSQAEEVEMLKKMVDKFKSLFADEESKNKALQDGLNTQREQVTALDHDKARIASNLHACESSLRTAQQKVALYESSFNAWMQAYESYQQLGASSKASLAGIFKGDSLTGFIAAGVQRENIDSFYEYLKYEMIEAHNQDIPALTEIFNTLFDMFLLAYPKYHKDHSQVDDEYDTARHIKVGNGVSGNIKQVLLLGWHDSKTQKQLKQTIVTL